MAIRQRPTAGATRTRAVKPREQVNWSVRLRNISTVLVLLTLILGTVYLNNTDTLPIMHVTVEGELINTEKQALIEAVTPYVTGSFLDVNVAGIRQAGEALPWVAQIQVRRVWPDTLHLMVSEHQAIARWNENGLVNTRGQVFYPDGGKMPEGLIQLFGPDGNSELMARQMVTIQQTVETLGLRVKSLTMDERRSWQVKFTDDMQLLLGRAASEQRLARFIQVFQGPLAIYREQIETVDMRYTNGLAVVWKDGKQPVFNGIV
ncbi:FtsQ-type POTRA domain-containing protein [Methylophaga sp. SB9B]|uniref:cell division protein FtsQ/DivIB n=1 Tax=Methylophaga sp. SB9B TaxID=2570356 RepID=UPI0010A8B1B0|nr:cell division protein FtsQ/DivIB [Methylophaga sp. SB9B]THK43346.1 FtsQ-type POTRA domain-containing protein [Methylophaga sp. SB9B]